MKILIVSPKFHPVIGGGETFVLHSAEQLHNAGHTICVATEPHPDRDLQTYDYTVREISGLSDAHLNVITSADGIYELLQSFKPDVIHTHGYFAQLAIGLINKNIPVVTSIHSTPVWGERIIGGMHGFEQERLFAKHILEFTSPQFLTAANDVYSKAAEKLTTPRTPVAAMPYPLLDTFFDTDHDRSIFRTKFRLKNDHILLTIPSRVIERKGIKEAVEAFAQLPDNYFLCIPCAVQPLDATYWKKIKLSKAFSKTSDRIIIPNKRILPEEMPLLYAASDVVVMPSYYEGAPVATVEAMASQSAFVGADSQGINGFIRHKINGLLVPKGSVSELADAIRQLGEDVKLREKLGKKAAEDVRGISWHIQLPKLIALYKKAISSND